MPEFSNLTPSGRTVILSDYKICLQMCRLYPTVRGHLIITELIPIYIQSGLSCHQYDFLLIHSHRFSNGLFNNALGTF